MNLSLFFAMAFGVGAMCFWLFVGETIQGRMTRYTTWKEMTIGQWVLFLGSFLWPIGFLGLLLLMSFLVATTFVIGSGWIFLWWLVLEFSQGGLTRYSSWKTLTLSQWVLFISSFLWLISVLGLFIIFKG